MPTITEWAQKKYARVTESKWTKLFIASSVLQLLVVVALEARVLSRNEEFKRKVEECSEQKPQDRMTLIIQENAIFMIFQFFQLWLCLNAVVKQNTIQIISLIVTNIICAFYGLVQIFEIIKWKRDLKEFESKCPPGMVASIQRKIGTVDLPLVIVLILFALIMAFLAFKLYQQFGWNIYKKIGADISMQKVYKTMLIFVMLLKLNLFFVLLLAIEVFFAFNSDDIGKVKNPFTFTIPKGLYYFHLVVTIMILFLELLAYRSVRKEWKPGMAIYIALSTVVMVDFVLILRFATKTVTNSWYFFIVFLGVALILSSVTWVYAILVYRNFDKGLEDILRKKKNDNIDDDPEIGPSSRIGGNKKFTIDD